MPRGDRTAAFRAASRFCGSLGVVEWAKGALFENGGWQRYFVTWAAGNHASDEQYGVKELEVACTCRGATEPPRFALPAGFVGHWGW